MPISFSDDIIGVETLCPCSYVLMFYIGIGIYTFFHFRNIFPIHVLASVSPQYLEGLNTIKHDSDGT